jgi:hypothetical protein
MSSWARHRIERHESIILIYITPGVKRCREMADVGCIRLRFGVRGFVLNVNRTIPNFTLLGTLGAAFRTGNLSP